jgi:hypothetical protein
MIDARTLNVREIQSDWVSTIKVNWEENSLEPEQQKEKLQGILLLTGNSVGDSV